MSERRNFQSRSAAVQRVLERLRLERRGVRLHDLQDQQLRPGVAERILKRLAIRGLVRVTEGRWEPQPVLLAGATISGEPEAA
jgi:hypothetical protein